MEAVTTADRLKMPAWWLSPQQVARAVSNWRRVWLLPSLFNGSCIWPTFVAGAATATVLNGSYVVVER